MSGAGTSDGPARFPYVAAALCAACVGSAVWLFFAYSYAWEVTPKDVVEGRVARVFGGSTSSIYVRLRGCTVKARKSFRGESVVAVPVQDAGDPDEWVIVMFPVDAAPSLDPEAEVVLTGRLALKSYNIGKRVFRFDASCSRWTGESVSGLVVGAMGVFVFAVAFLHWRKQRSGDAGRASSVEA